MDIERFCMDSVGVREKLANRRVIHIDIALVFGIR